MRRQRVLIRLALCCVALLPATNAVRAQSRTGILQYDKKGAVTGVIEEQDKAVSKQGAPAAAAKAGAAHKPGLIREYRGAPPAGKDAFAPGGSSTITSPGGFVATMRWP